MRYSVQVTTAYRRTLNGCFVLQHISRRTLGQAIVQHTNRFVRMAQVGSAAHHDPMPRFTDISQWESHVPPPVPFGATSAPGVTTDDMLLRSLDPFISPEGRVVWVPHFAVRYPLSKGHVRPYCQRTRW